MNTPFPFSGMLLFGFLSALLLAGVWLRARVGLLQRFLFPSCLIGGFLGLALLGSGLVSVSADGLQALAYHCFNISFISVGLTAEGSPSQSRRRGTIMRGSLWMALTQGVTFPLQAVIGGLLVTGFGLLGIELFTTFGFLVPLGFNEGPGQALSFGKVWEQSGFAHGATIGLTFAAMGYFFAFFIGVPLVNRGIRRGRAAHTARGQRLSEETRTGLLPPSTIEPAGRLTTHSGNIESLAFHSAVVGAIYLVTTGAVRILADLLPPGVGAMLWGFFFFFGLAAALACRWAIGRLGGGHLLDPGIQRRITGWSIDYLIVATVAAIQVTVIWTYAVPIAVVGLTAGLATTAVVVLLGRRLEHYGLERTVAIYGTVTGTVSCGLLLLRMVDPEFKTPVAMEIALMNVMVLPFVGGCTVLVNGPLWWNWSIGLTVAVFAAVAALSLALMRVFGFWGPRGRGTA